MGDKAGEALGLSIKIKAAFPVLWDREYYTVAEKIKETRMPCTCCDNTGKVTIIQKLRVAVSGIEDLIAKAKRYTDITQLTPELLRLFIQKIVVHEKRAREKHDMVEKGYADH